MLEPTRAELKAVHAHEDAINDLNGLLDRAQKEDAETKANATRVGANYRITNFLSRLDNAVIDRDSTSYGTLVRDSYVVHWAPGRVREVFLVYPMMAPQNTRFADESFTTKDLPLLEDVNPGYASFGLVDHYDQGGQDSDGGRWWLLCIHKDTRVNDELTTLALRDERFTPAWRHIIDDVRAMHAQLDAIVEMERRRREAFVAENDKSIDVFLQKQLQERLGLR